MHDINIEFDEGDDIETIVARWKNDEELNFHYRRKKGPDTWFVFIGEGESSNDFDQAEQNKIRKAHKEVEEKLVEKGYPIKPSFSKKSPEIGTLIIKYNGAEHEYSFVSSNKTILLHFAENDSKIKNDLWDIRISIIKETNEKITGEVETKDHDPKDFVIKGAIRHYHTLTNPKNAETPRIVLKEG